ncbi:hypothetical protein [Nocardioides albus]|uniref:Uncharacterized protein n=1 Tax=Nocardioides albus TaxID=1841 RepID=A0A7W5A6S7_9ACTN|nr:hypothetical protein [Nocardioides albus]MBB3090736.1 hypothetical protein [Nocardioides albus]
MGRARALSRVMGAAVLVAAGAALAGCSDLASDERPTGEAPAPDAEFEVSVEPTASQVTVHYTLTNRTDRPLRVIDKPAVAAGAGVRYRNDVAYATGDGEGGVMLSQALFGMPDVDVEFESIPRVGITDLAAGETLEADVVVPRPIAWNHPWGDLGEDEIELPEDPESIRFCLGVVSPPFPEAMLAEAEDDGVTTVTHASADQHLFCSDPATL